MAKTTEEIAEEAAAKAAAKELKEKANANDDDEDEGFDDFGDDLPIKVRALRMSTAGSGENKDNYGYRLSKGDAKKLLDMGAHLHGQGSAKDSMVFGSVKKGSTTAPVELLVRLRDGKDGKKYANIIDEKFEEEDTAMSLVRRLIRHGVGKTSDNYLEAEREAIVKIGVLKARAKKEDEE